MSNDLIPNRIYEHYKGGKYLVLLVAEDSTNDRITDDKKNKMVVYVSLTNGKIWCRTLSEFAESVEWPDGQRRSRFVLVTKE